MGTTNKTRMTNKFIMADTTLFRSVSGVDIDNPDSSSGCFVVYEGLQLPKCPLMHPFVVSGCSSDVAQVFHHDNRWITADDALADSMVSPSHKPYPSATEAFEMPLGRFSAFGLKSANQFIIFNSETLDLFPIEQIIGCDRKIVYADINSKNSVLETRAFGIDVFSECEEEETSASFVHPEKTLSDIPCEVFFVAVGDSEWNLNPALDCTDAQDIAFEGSTSWEVISDRCSVDSWLGLSLFDHTTTLPDTTDGKLRLKSQTFEMFVNQTLQSEFVCDMILPSSINTELQSLFIDFKSINYFWFWNNLDFSGYSCLHKIYKEQHIYKAFYESITEETNKAIHPLFKNRGVLAHVL